MNSGSRRLELEAGVTLILARVAVRSVPFPWLVRWLERPPRRQELRGPRRRRARREVRTAVGSASRYLPGRTACGPKAIAAQTMLRRRGVSTVLYLGIGPEVSGIRGHTWLKDGDAPVVGVRGDRPYLPVATYPSTPS
jgi:Transglutaminase-like superfamily